MNHDSKSQYTVDTFRKAAENLLSGIASCSHLSVARERLVSKIGRMLSDAFRTQPGLDPQLLVRSRDCADTLLGVLHERSDIMSGFSVAQALWDVARNIPRDDLQEGFFAEMTHWILGLQGQALIPYMVEASVSAELSGRDAAIARSNELDKMWRHVEDRMSRYADGLNDEVIANRTENRRRICSVMAASEQEWNDWQWQTSHLITDAQNLGSIVELSPQEQAGIEGACKAHLPFGITPYYASLMDRVSDGRDRAIRAQVIPPLNYVSRMEQCRGGKDGSCDFMLESDTSPVDRITRRYPAIVILKPFNTCPQICVYCQRNWEIDQAMAPDALADEATIDSAIDWLKHHPSVREVLVTGGDPMAMTDEQLGRLFEKLAGVDHVDMIRLGTRTPVTLPMRFTPAAARMIGSFRKTGRRDIAIVTHVEHPYEITPEMAAAVDLLKRQGLSIYNQQVYTFYVSRRFETAKLRVLLRRIGIQPYYTFVPKGKEETANYRVPIARILQEAKEEARLLPGSRRTDEPVYNVPGLGKNYLRAAQHRAILSLLGDGSRIYEFHPWEKNIAPRHMHTAADVPILEYLRRLEQLGEQSEEYQSIWYYF
ncbi:MAG: KamA family radical SAM protein [Planctomycetes bacterium]|jgi:lysine 2,3-aminomutase|nr:KamA family radical SAM protein [Planctomycetota bacterium]